MEAFVMNLGILVLIAAFMSAAYFFRIATSFAVAVIFLATKGINGYYIIGGSLFGLVTTVCIIFFIIDFIIMMNQEK